MGKIALALIALSASADGLGANDGSSSRDACEADCTGSGDERRCVFEARLDIHASSTGYYKFAQCGSTPQPVLAMEQGVEYTFRQKSASNWFHPLGFAYAPDGAHRGNPELEPGMTLTGSECYHSSTCQSPIYFLGNHFLGGTEDGAVRYPRLANNGDSGLYPYEPRFAVPRPDWQAKRDKADEGYKVKLTLTDEAYTKDLFYFCHVHNHMSGRIKLMRRGESKLLQSADEPKLGYAHEKPSAFDEKCGTYGLGSFAGEHHCDKGMFTCGEAETEDQKLFVECLNAMDCAMHEQMRVNVHANDPLTTFMQQMIPHHANAVNMAKALIKLDKTNEGNDPDGELEHLLWGIVNVQNMQIHTMEAWLADNGRKSFSGAHCEYSGSCHAALNFSVYAISAACVVLALLSSVAFLLARARHVTASGESPHASTVSKA